MVRTVSPIILSIIFVQKFLSAKSEDFTKTILILQSPLLP